MSDLPAHELADAHRALALLATRLVGRNTTHFPGGDVIEVTYRLVLTPEENNTLTKAIRAAADQEQR